MTRTKIVDDPTRNVQEDYEVGNISKVKQVNVRTLYPFRY
jgi:hypothetical protein